MSSQRKCATSPRGGVPHPAGGGGEVRRSGQVSPAAGDGLEWQPDPSAGVGRADSLGRGGSYFMGRGW